MGEKAPLVFTLPKQPAQPPHNIQSFRTPPPQLHPARSPVATLVWSSLGMPSAVAFFNPFTKQLAGGSMITKDFKVRLTTIGTSIHSSKGYKLNYKQTGCS